MNTRGRNRHRKGGFRVVPLMVALVLAPLLAGLDCESGDRLDQVRTAAAPAVVDFFTALGTLVGESVAAALEPVPDTPDETQATTAE